ncbi:MAG: hypothetical protein J0L93_10610 [Deltaproteobacteria bacterium]|nr:hypothetical protein [Deltaproteobacteria bacterium]
MNSTVAADSLPELDSLSEQIGNFIEYWGFKHIHGRIWLHLFLSKKPLDSLCLRKRLKVSKALISISLKDLLQFEVIKIVGKSSEGTLLYSASEDLQKIILNVLRIRERQMLMQINLSQKSLESLAPHHVETFDLSPEQIKKIREMTEAVETVLDTALSMSKISASVAPLCEMASASPR